MKTPVHVLVYVKRQLGEGRGAPRRVAGYSAEALLHPAGHGFGQKWLFDLARTGQPMVIWLFSVMRYQGLCLPPALDARMAVSTVFTQGDELVASPYLQWLLESYGYAFGANTNEHRSYYLPWNHFGPTLNRIIAGASMPTVESEVQSFGIYARSLQRFQTPRRLGPDEAALLEAYAEQVRVMPRAFISYRRKEAPVLAMQTAARVFHLGLAPWWDQWAMPRKIAEEEALCASPVLNKALKRAINAAQYAITIETPTYGDSCESPATWLELDRITKASQAGKLVHVALQGGASSPTDPAMAKRTVDKMLGAMGNRSQSRH